MQAKYKFSRAAGDLVACNAWDTGQGASAFTPDIGVQRELLHGFRKFYPSGNAKRAAVDRAVGIRVHANCIGGRGQYVFVLVDTDGVETTVSKNCKPETFAASLDACCRGAVHAGQIAPFKAQHGMPTDEVDHCNPGGFAALVRGWLAEASFTDAEIEQHMARPDPRSHDARRGFRSLSGEVARSWCEYHRAHAALQCLSRPEHRAVTGKRRREQT